MINNINWTHYSWDNKDTNPPKVEKYLIYRIDCDKICFEKWNGSGWSFSNNEALKWAYINKPKNK